MNNYVNYPKHAFKNNSCIIVFGDDRYSWCFLTESNKRYLSTSDYISDAKRIDLKTGSGIAYSMMPEQFKSWIKSGDPEPDKSLIMRPDDTGIDLCCPICGKALVIRTAKVGPNKGKQFWGCVGFPECKFTRSI